MEIFQDIATYLVLAAVSIFVFLIFIETLLRLSEAVREVFSPPVKRSDFVHETYLPYMRRYEDWSAPMFSYHPVGLRFFNTDSPIRGHVINNEQGFRAPVYVRKAITPQTNLALYFEVYNLVFGDDDQTHYTVSYKVSVDEKRKGIAGLLGRRELETTAVSTSHTGYSLTTREYVTLDLAEWDTADRMLITVRLLDEVTGKAADRSIEFVLMN